MAKSLCIQAIPARSDWRRLIVTAGLSAVLIVAAGSGTGAAVRPPKLDYTMTTLPNGLQVVFLEDHSTPIVHTEIWYHVGSKNEKPGHTGFAHLFEHMMFKGSKNVEPEGHPSYISSVGGQSNAYTNEDSTVFWETTPAQYLPLVLWLEADRMASLRIEDACLQDRARSRQGRAPDARREPALRAAERDHLRPGVHGSSLQAPDHRQHERISRRHRSRTSATSSAPITFRTTPRSCWSGTSTQRKRRSSSRSTSAACRNPSKPVPRDIPKEPPQTKERRVSLTESWPLPAVVVAYHITYDGHPDSYPLHIASKVLSDGQSARIYRDLVYTKQIALAAFGGGNIIEDPNLFFAVAIVQPGKTPQECIDALIAEFDRLKTEPISANELQQAKNQFARDYILGRESDKDKAEALAHAVVIHNDIKTADGEFDIFMNITRRRRPARGEDVLHTREPARDDDHAQGHGHRRGSLMPSPSNLSRTTLAILTALMAAVLWPAAGSAQVKDWPSERPPRPLPAREVKFPPYSVRTLPNGLQVIAVSQNEQPAVSLRLIVRAGGRSGSGRQAGCRDARGGSARSGDDHEERRADRQAIDSIGGALGTGAGSDLSFVNAVVMKDSLDVGLDMVSDLVRHPAFAAGGNRAPAAAGPLGSEGQLRRSGLPGRGRVRPGRLRSASVRTSRFRHPGFDCQHLAPGPPGIPQGLVRREQRNPRHRRRRDGRRGLCRRRARFRIVGDSAEHGAAGADPPPSTRRVVVIDRPGAVQTEIRVGNIGLPRKHPDYLALDLAIKILGGEGGNRLHRVLRSERGLTYGASADTNALKDAGDIVADTDTRSETTGEALRLIVEEFSKLQRERVSERELSDAQAYLTGNFPLIHRDAERDCPAGAERGLLRPGSERAADIPRARERRHDGRHPACRAPVPAPGQALHRPGGGRVCVREAAARRRLSTVRARPPCGSRSRDRGFPAPCRSRGPTRGPARSRVTR